MSAIVVDTSVWISYFRGVSFPEIDAALGDGRVYLPPIVAAELLSGRLTKQRRNQLLSFLSDLPLCPSDFDHWARVGVFRQSMSALGLSISTPDAHVAQCAFDIKAELLSEDKVFEKIKSILPDFAVTISNP